MSDRGFLKHIWFKLLDEEGIPVSGASIFIYDFDSNELNIYESDGQTLITQPFLTTSGGILEFYVNDDIGVPSGSAPSATGHYPWNTDYIISWSKDDKSGLIRGDHLFGEYQQVDETDSTSTITNKALSNYLGWILEDHMNFMVGTVYRCGSSSSSSSSSLSSSSSSSSVSVSAACMEGWIDVTSDTYWSPSYGSWDAGNSRFNSVPDDPYHLLGLNPVDAPSWLNGKLPPKIRVGLELQSGWSGTPTDLDFDYIRVYDTSFNLLYDSSSIAVSAYDVNMEFELYLDYSAGYNDPAYIEFAYQHGGFFLNSIEIYEDCADFPSASSSSSSTSSSSTSSSSTSTGGGEG